MYGVMTSGLVLLHATEGEGLDTGLQYSVGVSPCFL